MSRFSKLLILLSMVVFSLALVACGGGASEEPAAEANNNAAPEATDAPAAEGEQRTIAVSGAFALFPMMTVWAEQYSAVNPNVRFDVQGGGAGKGMTDVLAGAVDIAMVSVSYTHLTLPTKRIV